MANQMILPDLPFRVEFEVTSTCNLECVGCYWKSSTNKHPELEDLDFLFRKTQAEVDPFEIIILGGEPFIRRDIIDVLERADSTFKSGVGMSTNGTLLDGLGDDKWRRLKLLTEKDKGLSLQVSLDSLNPEVNDKSRGKTRETIKGIDALERHGVQFSVGIVLTSINASDVMDTARGLLSNYKCLDSINLEPLQPTISMTYDSYNALRLSSESMVGIYNGVNRLASEAGRKDVKIVGVVEECTLALGDNQPLIDTYGFKTCTAGLLRSGVFVDGTVTPCVTIRNVPLGNLYTESWREIWSRSKERFMNLDIAGGQCILNIFRDKDKTPDTRLIQINRERLTNKR
ncbi:MAG: radical SAM protein [Candidatus Micrarchaeota archaeon]|nr:radical SAM protein [Candidatus Micrarchaeota archaeon]